MKKILSFALVALVCAAFTSCNKSDPGEVALNGYKAMMEGTDITPYVAPDVDKNLIEEINKSSKANAKTLKDAGATQDYKLVGVEENGDKATANIHQSLTVRGETRTDTVKLPLVKVDGKWYLWTPE